nr:MULTISPECIES: PIN domain-containing protein [unclassified Streptomyces]
MAVDRSAQRRIASCSRSRRTWPRTSHPAPESSPGAGSATCPITEPEFFHSARSAADRARGIEDVRLIFGWVPVDDRASQVQEALTKQGKHRSAGAVDLVVAATAELQGLTLLHCDHDFECIAAVTGQPLQWYGPERRK